jgi:hypothetical protein
VTSLTMMKVCNNHDSIFIPMQILTPIILLFVARCVAAEQLGNFTWPPDDMSASSSAYPSPSPSVSQEPSVSSSLKPSSFPSTSPSLEPTFECHDQVTYRSPINALNCSQHNGTDCFEWKHLGLSPFEVEELISSCPVACDIACGALFVFEANLTYYLLELDNFLSPETTILLEEATSEYLTNFILEKNETSRFSLNVVEFLSQRRIETTSDQQHAPREIQETENHLVDLEVSVGLQGFFLELSLEIVEEYLEEGIDTFGYMRALRFTNDPALQFVEVHLHIQDEVIIPNATTTTMKIDDINTSRWKVLLTVFVITGVFCVFLLYILKKNKTFVDITEKEIDLPILSPAASMASSRFALVPDLSQDSAVRFSSIDKIQRTTTPTSFPGSSESGLSLKTSPNTSLQSKSASVDEEHPLTGVIPPMIVYDNIESTNEHEVLMSEGCAREKMKLVVPYRMVTATNSFRVALENNSLDALDKSMYACLQTSFNPGEGSLNEERKANHCNKYQLNAISESGSTSSARTLKAGVSERDILNDSESQHDHSLTNQTEILEHHGFKIGLQAPRFGKVGLVIQCSALNWPLVLLVKQYSPLYLDVLPGDRLLTVDGEDMFGTTLDKVTERMKGTTINCKQENNSLPILIWRPHVLQTDSNVFSTALQLPKGRTRPSNSASPTNASQSSLSKRSSFMKATSMKSMHSLMSLSRSNFSKSEQSHRRSLSAAHHHERLTYANVPPAAKHRRSLSGDSVPVLDIQYPERVDQYITGKPMMHRNL